MKYGLIRLEGTIISSRNRMEKVIFLRLNAIIKHLIPLPILRMIKGMNASILYVGIKTNISFYMLPPSFSNAKKKIFSLVHLPFSLKTFKIFC